MISSHRIFTLAHLILFVLVSTQCAIFVSAAEEKDDVADTFFESRIRPLLLEHCVQCHGADKQEAGLRLDSSASVVLGGEGGPVVVPGFPEKSPLITAVRYLGDIKMPPKQKLTENQIAILTEWVASGAQWPASENASASARSSEFAISLNQRNWWSFRPLENPALPEASGSSWSLNEIDLFVEARLRSENLEPSAEADRRTWIRRITFDLTGLAPTMEDVSQFQTDQSADACEKVVDRLLNSPTYGQRWARHWLDVVRYADYHDGDPKARDTNCEPMQAWRYRDWVVNAFNDDMPWDQFIRHQIAGDLMPPPAGHSFYADGLIATTFLSNGTWDRGDADKEKMVSDMVDDNIDTIGKAFLGLTLGCARCHNHKFDPVSQEDYYALAGIFYSTRILKDLGIKGGNYTLNRVPLVEPDYLRTRDDQLRVLDDLKMRIEAIARRSPATQEDEAERSRLTAQRDQLQNTMLPEPPMAEAVTDGGTPGGLFPGIQDVPVHIRGSYTRPGQIVRRRMPSFFTDDSEPPVVSGSGRRELAAWVASPKNPLTARVIVNRVWQGHFGTGLVATPNNLGMQSEPPVHRELLDWLSTRLISENWSLKKLHRRILLSATYRQGSHRNLQSRGRSSEAAAGASDSSEADPENRFLGRFVPRRLEAEAIRDAMLQVSGCLDVTPGGPAADDLNTTRRSLYVQTARWDRSSFASLFDAANPDASHEKRDATTVAPQSLFLLNHPFVLTQAEHLADRVQADRLQADQRAEHIDQETQKVDQLFKLLFQRHAEQKEIQIAQGILQQSEQALAWRDLAHILLCSSEFIYID
jgi:cytochrome c553